jgi:hypothetical protein
MGKEGRGLSVSGIDFPPLPAALQMLLDVDPPQRKVVPAHEGTDAGADLLDDGDRFRNRGHLPLLFESAQHLTGHPPLQILLLQRIGEILFFLFHSEFLFL